MTGSCSHAQTSAEIEPIKIRSAGSLWAVILPGGALGLLWLLGKDFAYHPLFKIAASFLGLLFVLSAFFEEIWIDPARRELVRSLKLYGRFQLRNWRYPFSSFVEVRCRHIGYQTSDSSVQDYVELARIKGRPMTLAVFSSNHMCTSTEAIDLTLRLASLLNLPVKQTYE